MKVTTNDYGIERELPLVDYVVQQLAGGDFGGTTENTEATAQKTAEAFGRLLTVLASQGRLNPGGLNYILQGGYGPEIKSFKK